jgi:hypothetical protein
MHPVGPKVVGTHLGWIQVLTAGEVPRPGLTVRHLQLLGSERIQGVL